MSTQHTPGPWSVQERKDGLGALPNRNSLEIVHNYKDGGGQQIVVGKHTGIDCLNEANAALIAAAPELLEQLKLLVRWAEDQGETCSFARAAIRKAEGGVQ